MLASGARLLGMLSCTVSLLGCRVRGLAEVILVSALVAWRVVVCYVLSIMLGCEAYIVNVMLAWDARMLGMLSCAVFLVGC